MKNFSRMLCETREIKIEKGELEGKCCICGEHTKQGHKKKFSGNFTSADYISDGDVICEYCKHLVDNSNEYRRTMFLITEKEYKPFKKDEAKEIVLNLPDKPFYIYLTKTWQKIGWVMLNQAPNNSNKGVINFLVDYDIVRTDLKTLKELMILIKELRELKIPKQALESGVLEVHHYRRIVSQDGTIRARKINNYIKNYAKNPVWELALYLEK